MAGYDRRRRLRSQERPTVCHISFHITEGLAAEIGPYPFDDERIYGQLLDRICKALLFNTVKICAICTMGNHLHALAIGYPDPPSLKEAARRYGMRYPERPPLDPDNPSHHPELRKQARLMMDVGNFCTRIFSPWGRAIMHEIRESAPLDKHGRPKPLFFTPWAGRHNEVVAASDIAAAVMGTYITVNAARAGLPEKPAGHLPRNTLEFLDHPELRNVVGGFGEFMDIIHPGTRHLSFGEKRSFFRRICEAEKRRLREAAERGDPLPVDIDGDGSLGFDPEAPDGTPYLTLSGVVGLERDVRRHVAECYGPELAARRLKHACGRSGLCALLSIRARRQRSDEERTGTAANASNGPPP
jgi:REP element-mobilizing transposase RayT